jgi:hypothetical protein
MIQLFGQIHHNLPQRLCIPWQAVRIEGHCASSLRENQLVSKQKRNIIEMFSVSGASVAFPSCGGAQIDAAQQRSQFRNFACQGDPQIVQ